ncbi:hypothetical protein [Effusibacillus lacus]|nr:hypothetical protein [Effusibacillus lacus]TCS74583.1 hypothetical protein EDD64_11231 [Effusibacillus lacus]
MRKFAHWGGIDEAVSQYSVYLEWGIIITAFILIGIFAFRKKTE